MCVKLFTQIGKAASALHLAVAVCAVKHLFDPARAAALIYMHRIHALTFFQNTCWCGKSTIMFIKGSSVQHSSSGGNTLNL